MSNPPDIIVDDIKAGEPIEILFSYWENGYELPIAGYPLSIVMRRDKLAGAKVIEWIDNDPAITRSDTTGKINLMLSAQFTATLKASVVFLDCWLKKDSTGDGLKSTVVQLNISRGVPR